MLWHRALHQGGALNGKRPGGTRLSSATTRVPRGQDPRPGGRALCGERELARAGAEAEGEEAPPPRGADDRLPVQALQSEPLDAAPSSRPPRKRLARGLQTRIV